MTTSHHLGGHRFEPGFYIVSVTSNALQVRSMQAFKSPPLARVGAFDLGTASSAENGIFAHKRNRNRTIHEVPIRNSLSEPLSISKRSYGSGIIALPSRGVNLVVQNAGRMCAH